MWVYIYIGTDRLLIYNDLVIDVFGSTTLLFTRRTNNIIKTIFRETDYMMHIIYIILYRCNICKRTRNDGHETVGAKVLRRGHDIIIIFLFIIIISIIHAQRHHLSPVNNNILYTYATAAALCVAFCDEFLAQIFTVFSRLGLLGPYVF